MDSLILAAEAASNGIEGGWPGIFTAFATFLGGLAIIVKVFLSSNDRREEASRTYQEKLLDTVHKISSDHNSAIKELQTQHATKTTQIIDQFRAEWLEQNQALHELTSEVNETVKHHTEVMEWFKNESGYGFNRIDHDTDKS